MDLLNKLISVNGNLNQNILNKNILIDYVAYLKLEIKFIIEMISLSRVCNIK